MDIFCHKSLRRFALLLSFQRNDKDVPSVRLSLLLCSLHSLQLFQEVFSYVPWTFSFSHPLTDVEYAGDTVLLARTNDTLCRILHLLQHLAARIGLLLNGSKCQLLTIHASLPVSLSLTADSGSHCNCLFCAPFFFSTPWSWTFHPPHCPVPSIWAHLLLPPPQSLMSIIDLLKPLPPLKL